MHLQGLAWLPNRLQAQRPATSNGEHPNVRATSGGTLPALHTPKPPDFLEGSVPDDEF
jgi:hypothetical protein